jgi:hypothetical protein
LARPTLKIMKPGKGKNWNDKIVSSRETQSKILTVNFADMKIGENMFIANPKIIDSYIRNIPSGKLVDSKTMRKDLALQHSCDVTCPVTTGIFLRIVIEAANEKYLEGVPLKDLTPVWRIFSMKDPIAKKLSFDLDWVRSQQEKENITT